MDGIERARRLEGFDGLRALAAVLVVAYHAGSLAGASSSGGGAAIVAELKAGVTVFFVISGFLLYLPYARALGSRSALPDWRRFADRRCIRIIPAYWVVLTLLGAAGLASHVFTLNWWRYYAFAQIYDPHTLKAGLPVAWSLCTEVSFYMLLPGFAWTLSRTIRVDSPSDAVRRQLLVLAGMVLAALLLRGVLADSLRAPVPDSRIVLATSLPGTLDWFVLGMAMAVARAGWEHGVALPTSLRVLAERPGLCWLGAAAAYLIGVPSEHGEVFIASYGVATHFAIGLAAALLVLPAAVPRVVARRAWTTSMLSSPLLVWLGTISYGLYLWHVPLLLRLDSWAGRPRGAIAFLALFLAALAGGVLLGAASWYLIERPAHRWWRRRRTGTADGTTREGLRAAAVSTQASGHELPIQALTR